MQESLQLKLSVDQNSKLNSLSSTNKNKQNEEMETEVKPMFTGRSLSQAISSRVTPTIDVSCTGTVVGASYSCGGNEKGLANGDLYTGSFSGNVPHESGKYLWADGCMYEGYWKRGKAYDKGRFSWSSGSTFEGEFKSVIMEGSRTFIGSDGDTYRGSWSGDQKHGYDQKHYRNDDYYEGSWRKNLHDGFETVFNWVC